MVDDEVVSDAEEPRLDVQAALLVGAVGLDRADEKVARHILGKITVTDARGNVPGDAVVVKLEKLGERFSSRVGPLGAKGSQFGPLLREVPGCDRGCELRAQVYHSPWLAPLKSLVPARGSNRAVVAMRSPAGRSIGPSDPATLPVPR